MGNNRRVGIGLALAGAALVSGLLVWQVNSHSAVELSPSVVPDSAPATHRHLPAQVAELPSGESTERAPVLARRDVRLSKELRERLKTYSESSDQQVLTVELPMELAGSEAWLQIAREGEDGQAIEARIDRDGLASFPTSWTGPANLFLGTNTWIGDPADVYVSNPAGYFDARPYVHVAQLAVRVPEGSAPPKGLRVECLRPEALYTVEVDLTAAGQDAAVAFAQDEMYVRFSAQGYRDLEFTIRPGHHVIDLQPGFRVEIRIEGVGAETMAKKGVLAWLSNGHQVEMLHIRSRTATVVLPEAGWWNLTLGKPFSWTELKSASSQPAWVSKFDGSPTSLSGGLAANPPKWSTTIHVDEMDTKVTLQPVWEEQ